MISSFLWRGASTRRFPAGGGEWSGASVRDILRNPVYCGEIRWQYRRQEKSLADGKTVTRRRRNDCCIMTQGLHHALVSAEDFARAQQCLDASRQPRTKSCTELRNPLVGLIYCGMCGAMMTRVGAGGRNRKYSAARTAAARMFLQGLRRA